MRASDAERAEVTDRLRAALDEGRLDLAEYDRRVQATLTATTTGELVPLTSDLPTDDRARRIAADARGWYREWGAWLGGAVIMTAIWGVNCLRHGEPDFYWPVAPLGIWAAILVAAAVWYDPDDKDD
jgi:hypothetical protein